MRDPRPGGGRRDHADVVHNPPRARHELTAFPSRDFVSPAGYAENETVTVEIIHPDGTARSTAPGLVPHDDPSTEGFDGIVEVNHPAGVLLARRHARHPCTG